MSTSSTDNICANCGKGEESSGDLKACTACKLVKYCNRECQIAHRPQHKRECKKRAAELYDEQLFKENPPREECPICMLPLPLVIMTNNGNSHTGTSFHSCCGKRICHGCIVAMSETGGKNMDLCAFCRTPKKKSNDEELQRVNQLIEKGNAYAYFILGGYYDQGNCGLPQDRAMANELFLKAGELGCAGAYYNLGGSYYEGMGVEIDKKKAMHFYELAAMNGDILARNNLGCLVGAAGNDHRAMKHFLLAARAGHNNAIDLVKDGYMNGHVTKDQYADSLREYQKSQDEMKSDARDKALAYLNSMHG